MSLNFQQFVETMISNGLGPSFTILVLVARLIGLFMIVVGMKRLYLMYGSNPGGRITLQSAMYFILSGTVLVAFMPELTALSSGIVGGSGNLPPEILTTCTPESGRFLNGGEIPCPMIAYAADVTQSGMTESAIMKEFAFAVMTFIGVYSFIRGFMLLVKIGEGQQTSLGNAMTHIIAGVVGVNASVFYGLMTSFLGAFGIN